MYSINYSQHDEQSIISSIIEKYNIVKKAIEIGINTGAKGTGTVLQGNTVFLKELGWECKWLDAKTVFPGVKKVSVYPENINQLIEPSDTIGIFSIDIDSEDWHVVKALLDHGHRPQLFVCETNSYLDPMSDLVMPLGHRRSIRPKSICHGATLKAFDNLLHRFNYNFMCTTKLGNNGFWIHSDLEKTRIPVVDYKDNRHPLTTNWAKSNETDIWDSSRELLA